jgi:hypothetical protein
MLFMHCKQAMNIKPNQGVQATAASVRSCLAPAVCRS